MKWFLVGILVWLISYRSVGQSFAAWNMELVARWQSPTALRYQGCWGYAAQGREYAFIGSHYGTHILDITDAQRPQLIATWAGKDTNVRWREYQTYQHYLYAIADGAANSLQIFDLSELPERVTKVYDSDSLSQSSHSLWIDEKTAKLYLFLNKRNEIRYAAEVFSLQDPTKPRYESSVVSLGFQAVHGGFARQDTAYFSAQTDGLFIYAWSNQNGWQPLSSLTIYPEQGFNHSCWLSENGRYLVFTDETFNSSIKLFDVSDKTQPVFVSLFKSNEGAIPHYAYWKQDKVYVAYYHDGVQVFDVSQPTAPQRVAFFDTHPENDELQRYVGFAGCWGVYPFLPSGHIIASDMNRGLFVLKAQNAHEAKPPAASWSVYPNPTQTGWHICGEADLPMQFSIIDARGQLLLQSQKEKDRSCVYVAATSLRAGVYWLRMSTGSRVQVQKIMKW